MVCKLCPVRRHCWDKGNCQNCDYGKAVNGLDSKNKKLKKKNEALEAENKELKAELDKYKAVVERDIVIVGRRQGKEAESREIIRYRVDLIREAAVREFAESLCEGRVENHPIVIAVKCELRSFLEGEGERAEDDH